MSGALPRPVELAFLALLILLVTLFTMRTDDLYWLAEVGRATLHEHSLPSENRYSFTAPTHPWQTHEWLSEVLVGLASDPVVFAVGLLLCWFPVALVLRVSASGRSLAGAAVLILTTGLAGMYVRPYLLGRALLGIVLSFRRSPPPWLTFLLFTLWVNLHGSFGYGIFVLAARAVFASREDRRHWAICLGTASLGCLLNPYGLAGAMFPLKYLVEMGRARSFLGHIIEWQAVTPFGDGFWPLVLAAAPGAFALVKVREERPRDALIWVVFVALAFKARRGLPDLALVSAMLVALRCDGSPARIRFSLAPPIMLALLCFITPVRSLFGYERYLFFHERANPAGLISYLTQLPGPPQRIFNEFDWGGGHSLGFGHAFRSSSISAMIVTRSRLLKRTSLRRLTPYGNGASMQRL